MALYHTHRPQQFSDIIGQDHIKTTLQNALKNGQVAHAYLFAGPRGLGKTTTARILAKAVNCENNLKSQISNLKITTQSSKLSKEKQTFSVEPCNTCGSCVAITKGSALDVLEIDAASNRGIDDVRQLREMVRFAPTNINKRVIIIDEVHMLTKEAFNALLKTLEEPPTHVLFILATTEPHKVPITILSRVQRFDLKPASIQMLADHLKNIAQKEKIKLDPEAAILIAELAEGSFRDAVSLLDQISTGSTTIQVQTVRQMLGLSEQKAIADFFNALQNNDRQMALKIIDDFFSIGKDPHYFIAQAIRQTRKMLRITFSNQVASWLTDLVKANEQLKYSPVPNLPLELFIAKQIHEPKNNAQIDSIQNKPEEITPKIEYKSARPQSVTVKTDEAKNIEPPLPRIKGKVNEEIWHKFINSLKGSNTSLAALLQGSHLVKSGDGICTIAVKYKFHKDKITQTKNLLLLEETLEKTLNKRTKIECIIDSEYVAKREKKEESLLKDAIDIFK